MEIESGASPELGLVQWLVGCLQTKYSRRMKAPIFPAFLAPHVALQETGNRLQQIHQNQPIEGVTKFPVDIEAEQQPAEVQILAQKNRYAALPILELPDDFRYGGDVRKIGKLFALPE